MKLKVWKRNRIPSFSSELVETIDESPLRSLEIKNNFFESRTEIILNFTLSFKPRRLTFWGQHYIKCKILDVRFLKDQILYDC